MRTRPALVVLPALLALLTVLPAAGGAGPARDGAPLIEIAILLDTSNSMDGLIDQARSRLWSIVNTLATAKHSGKHPVLRVALFQYGNSTLPASENFIRLVRPLSDDLDALSAALFALTTRGGDEFCGAALEAALDRVAWTAGAHYQAIYIAGNEPFTQGPVAYEAVCRRAIAKGIAINTIHCGAESEGRQGRWDHAAALTDGRFCVIDQNAAIATIPAPQDVRLSELSIRINATYIGYGKRAAEGKANQFVQDSNAAGSGPAAPAERALAKSGVAYRNSHWDLCDALDDGTVDLSKLRDEDLPPDMRTMSPAERRAYVAGKKAERAAIAAEIRRLAADRERFLAAERMKLAGRDASTFESALRALIREQLARRGFVLESVE